MSRIMSDDLHDQFKKVFAMFRFTVEQFSPQEWLTSIASFDVPARIGWHTVESLDFYFSGNRNAQEFNYGYRFGDRPLWELPDEQMPAQAPLL